MFRDGWVIIQNMGVANLRVESLPTEWYPQYKHGVVLSSSAIIWIAFNPSFVDI
jgi:hypothetical protein